MEVIGVSKTTTSKNAVVLVLDGEMTDEILSHIEYGSLRFEADGRFLTVIIPQGQEDVFSETSITSLNGKLLNAIAGVNEARNKHHQMLQSIAANTKLPLI